eukprot:CAMPEP_0194130292 /NCGR_PEP_ID=MMETSP0152-20130528/1362_1 /TAXON_ID=1049557 /ORGANISM="Thalassiothrix antarctica, Strain L6-D1" /LENGTH=194 /DNA_ID=CAMNT_0038824763 /DNA_START=165 /DNA_END=749 /DNA_ORIENTATION=-
MADEPSPDLPTRVQNFISNFELDDISENVDAVRSNVLDGQLGSRGELYFVSQIVLVLCILGGGVPFIGDLLFLLFGPGILITGLGVTLISLVDLGDSLSPWPVPSDNGIKTSGIYAEIRHPTYAGLIAACIGISIISGSATRLLLTFALFSLLNTKAEKEEVEILKKYPDYADYQKKVKGRFFPDDLVPDFLSK